MKSFRLFLPMAVAATAFLLGTVACQQSRNEEMLQVKMASLEHCGATEPTIALVKATAAELNLRIDFQYVPITTVEQAREHRHLGSPTIQINGLDIEPAARSATQFGIS